MIDKHDDTPRETSRKYRRGGGASSIRRLSSTLIAEFATCG